jgi:hypothetical protein
MKVSWAPKRRWNVPNRPERRLRPPWLFPDRTDVDTGVNREGYVGNGNEVNIAVATKMTRIPPEQAQEEDCHLQETVRHGVEIQCAGGEGCT